MYASQRAKPCRPASVWERRLKGPSWGARFHVPGLGTDPRKACQPQVRAYWLVALGMARSSDVRRGPLAAPNLFVKIKIWAKRLLPLMEPMTDYGSPGSSSTRFEVSTAAIQQRQMEYCCVLAASPPNIQMAILGPEPSDDGDFPLLEDGDPNF